MVLVRHWSLVNLRRLFQLAEDEGAHPADSPPPSYREMAELDGDPRLSIAASEHRETSSSAMVKYQETPLSQLDASMNNAMLRPNRILHAPDNTVVDHLLDEWTRLREMKAQHQRRRHKYDPHYETDTETDSQSEFERSENIGGRYIEGPKRKPKNVHFRSRVESGSEHSDHTKPSRKPPSRHVLRSNNSSTSSLTSSSSSDDNIAPLPSSRRSSASSTASRKPDQNASTQRYTPPSPNSNGDGTQPVRPSSRGGPPPPPPPFLQSWQGQPPYPGVHPHPQPQQYINPAPPPPPPPGPRRAHSTLPYTPSYPPPGMQARAPYNPPLNPNLNPNLMHPHPHHHHHPHRGSTQQRRPSRTSRPPRERRAEKKESSFKENAKKDVKRGLLGAGAVAGLMDILEGLSGI